MFLNILVRDVGIQMVIGILCHTGGEIPFEFSPFSITLDLLSAAEASECKSVVKSLLETSDDEESDFLFLFLPELFFLLLFLSISWETELENVLCLLFLDFFFCLSIFLFGEGFATFALPTTFLAGSSGEFPGLPLSLRSV